MKRLITYFSTRKALSLEIGSTLDRHWSDIAPFHSRKFLTLLAFLLFVGVGQMWGADETVTWSVSTSTANTISKDSGTLPTGASASMSSNDSQTDKSQLTSGKKQTFTLTGMDGCTIKGVTINMKKSSKGSSATVTVKVGSTTLQSGQSITLSTTAGDKTVTLANTTTVVGTSENVVITVTAAKSSAYVLKYKVTYEAGSGGGTPTCATPTFSPAAGSYIGTQSVTISSTTTGSTIYYTTNGTTPTTSSSHGTEGAANATVSVSSSQTLKAYAVKDGANDSEVATAAYTIVSCANDDFDWDLRTNSYTTGPDEEVTWSGTYATMHNEGTNATNYLGGDANSRTSSRFYSGNALTITPASGVTISHVVFTATTDGYASTLRESTWTNATASGSGSYVIVTPTDGTSAFYATVGGTCGFTNVNVCYSAASCGSAPTVSNGSLKGSVSSTSSATAQCTGGITSLGSAGCSITSYGFAVGTSSNPTIGGTLTGTGATYQTSTTYTVINTGFEKEITGLSAGTKYYVRPYATNGNGTAYGTEFSFTTLHEYTLTYKETNGTANGSGKVVENATSFTNTSAPSKVGHDLEGFYTSSALTTKVASNARVLVANIDGWTGAGGKYTKGANADLYLKWTPTDYTITTTLTSCSWSSAISSPYTYDGVASAITRTVNPSSGYGCPTNITVTMGGATLTKGTDYTWSVTNGVGSFTLTKVITGNVAITITAQPMVTWMAGGSVFSTQVADANTALSSPGTPSPATYCPGGKVFVGWSANTIVGTSNTQPTDLFTDATKKKMPAGGITYYAVYATSSGTPSTSYAAITSGLASGDYVIAYEYNSNGTRVALQNVTDNSSPTTRMEGYALARDGSGKYANPAATYIWQLQKQNDGSYYIYDLASGMYLNATTSALQLSSTPTKFTITYDGTNSRWTIVIQDNTSYYMHGYTGSYTDFRISTSGSDSKYRIYLYKNEGTQTFSAYATTCCTELGTIGGVVTFNSPIEAKVTWNKISNVSSWTLKYKVHGAGAWSTAYTSKTSSDSEITESGDNLYSTIDVSCNTAYDFLIIANPASGYCDKEEDLNNSSAGYNSGTWTVTSTGVTNVTPATSIPTTTCDGFSIASMTPASGYHLPATIIVDNADHTWNSSTGALTISNVTGNVTITIEGEENGCSDYSFHSGGSDVWNTRAENKCFSLVSGTLWSVDYTIASYTHYCVNYQGGKYSTGGSHSVSFATAAWADMKFWERSFAVGVATGAKGKLKVYSDSYTTNLGVGFEPDGYGITYGGTGHAFATTGTANMWETEVVELPNVGSTTYTMGLATATAGTYVTCAHSSAAENINVMGMSSVEGGLRKIWLYSTAANWIGDNAKMAIWDATNSHWGNNTSDTKFMTKVNDNLWYGYVPTSATSIILVRVNPANADPAWDWGQSYDVTPNDVNNYITITGTWSNDAGDNNKSKAEYTIGSMHPTTGMNGKFRMWDNSGDNNWHVHFVPYYKLTYNANGGSNAPATAYGNSESANNVTVNNGSGLTAPDGKHFVKWNTANDGSGEDVAAGSFTLTEDLELFAIYDWDNYTVTVNKSGCASATVGADKATAHYGETVTLSADEPSGYAFVNWTTSDGVTFSPNASTKGATFTMPTSNVTVQANYHQIYTITWKVNNVALTGDALDGADVNVEQGSNLANVPSTAPADNSLNNCANKFMGWSKKSAGSTPKTTSYYDDLFTSASEFVDGGGTITENTTFYAVFAENLAGSKSLTQSEITSFYCTGPACGGATTSYASYTINSDDGNWSGVCNSAYSNPDYFVGVRSATVSISGVDTRPYLQSPSYDYAITNIAIRATHSSNSSRTIYICSSSTASPASNNVGTISVSKGNTTVQNIVPSSSITSFYIYSSDPVSIYSITVSYGAVSNYVTQCADNQVRVTYNANGGSTTCAGGVTTKNASYTVCATEPTKTGNDFTGWSDGSNTYAAGASYNLQATTTFTAQWEASEYTITYKDKDNAEYSGTNGGSLPGTHTYGSATALVNGSKGNGYRFDGWFTASDCTGDPITSIGATDITNDITLYAKWTVRHEIIFDADGTLTTIYRADDENMEDAVGVGTKPSDPDAPSACSSKVFVGWSEDEIVGETDDEPSDLFDGTGTVDEDKHFHAVWATAGSGSITKTYDWESATIRGWTVANAFVRTSSQGVSGSYAGKLNTSGTHYIKFNEKVNVTSFSFQLKRTTNNSNYSCYIDVSSDGSSWSEAASFDMSTFANGSYNAASSKTWDGNTAYYVRLAVYTTDAVRYVDNVSITYNGTTYSAYATTCCATKIVLSDPSITDASSSGSTITFDKSSPVYTCGGTKTVTATLTLTAGYQASALSFAVNSGTVSISPAISTPITSSQVYTLTFAEDQNATLTTTATLAAKPLNGITITPSSGEVYVGQYMDFTVSYDPADYLSKGYTLKATPVYVAKESAAPANTKLRLKGGRASGPGASITETVNETVTIQASGDNTKTASVDMTVNPLPRVHFVDKIHGESFDDVVATLTDNELTDDGVGQTPTYSDVSDPGSSYNACERQHLHLVGWIESTWADAHPGALPSEIIAAGATNYYAAGANINLVDKDTHTFYAVWSKVE